VPGPMGSEVGRVRDLIGRADLFLARLRERWAALRRIGGSIVEHQEGFLRRGASAMEPLTRADVARAVGLHESTVSRAVAGKFAMLPSGRVVPLADFFDRSLGVRTELRAIIADERRPLSDAELVEELRGSESSAYTERDVPIFPCVRMPIDQILDQLDGAR